MTRDNAAPDAELRPCPLCAKQDTSILSLSIDGILYRAVYCHQCGAAATTTQGDDEAVRRWNTRIADRRAEPISMLLFCPECGSQHIDEPDQRTPDWDNPPHRSHLCHDCGCIWRPADVATVGVRAIETAGKADNWTLADRRADGFVGMHFNECDYFKSRGSKPCNMDCCS